MCLKQAFLIVITFSFAIMGLIAHTKNLENNLRQLMTSSSTETSKTRAQVLRRSQGTDNDSLSPVTPSVSLEEDFPSVWDETINQDEERERCARYGFEYDGRTTRRRVFLGSMIAEDSWHALRAVAAEGYGIYHTVAYIESNTTQALYPRELRFPEGSKALHRLQSLYGPDTKVTVDTAIIHRAFEDVEGIDKALIREDSQREHILYRWKLNGMQPEDIGIVADADETFTRDFMRAAQICNLPNFAEGHGCRTPKVVSKAMEFETTPDCIVQKKLWWHPDLTLGECLEHVGNDRINKPLLRGFNDSNGIGYRLDMGGINERRESNESFPLINTADVRLNAYGYISYQRVRDFDADTQARIKETQQPVGYTAFHFHNFFGNASELRRKYYSYGHPNAKAYDMPLGALQKDVQLGLNCVMNRNDTGGHEVVEKHVVGGLDALLSAAGPIPILFQNNTYRKTRADEWRSSIEDDEAFFGRYNESAEA